MKKAPDDDLDQGMYSLAAIPFPGPNDHKLGFGSASTPSISRGAVGMRRAGTLIRSPIEGKQRDKEKQPEGDQRGSEVLEHPLNCILSS